MSTICSNKICWPQRFITHFKCRRFLWRKLFYTVTGFPLEFNVTQVPYSTSRNQWRCGPRQTTASWILRFLDHKQQRITLGRTPLDVWSARRRHLYLTTHNTSDQYPCPGGNRSQDLRRRAATEPWTARRPGPALKWFSMDNFGVDLKCKLFWQYV